MTGDQNSHTSHSRHATPNTEPMINLRYVALALEGELDDHLGYGKTTGRP